METTTEIQEIISKSKVNEETALTIGISFNNFMLQALSWKQNAMSILVTDESQTDLMEHAKKMRLTLRDIRIEADKKRKDMKEDSLNYGKAVQSVYGIIEGVE